MDDKKDDIKLDKDFDNDSAPDQKIVDANNRVGKSVNNSDVPFAKEDNIRVGEDNKPDIYAKDAPEEKLHDDDKKSDPKDGYLAEGETGFTPRLNNDNMEVNEDTSSPNSNKDND